jgi:hypothetical protein
MLININGTIIYPGELRMISPCEKSYRESSVLFYVYFKGIEEGTPIEYSFPADFDIDESMKKVNIIRNRLLALLDDDIVDVGSEINLKKPNE